MAEDQAETLRKEGNDKFKVGEYQAAIDAYTRSLELNPEQHLCYSNRSAAYAKLGDDFKEQALADGRKCVELDPSFVKGYSRIATALQLYKRWDEAIEACKQGSEKSPNGKDAALEKMMDEIGNARFRAELRGMWHGTVAKDLGGYEQEMEFLDEQSVRVEVLGRSIVGKYWVDCSASPKHLNIQVPMTDVPPGGPPLPPPPVPYIANINSEGLHLCCPYLAMIRPTDFTGPGYCLMKSGALQAEDDAEVASLSNKEKLRRCAQEIYDALPDSKLQDVNQTDSEDVAGEKLMSQVRFESSMYAVQKRFGQKCMDEVLASTKGCIPPELKDTKEINQLIKKLKACGIMDEDAPAGPGAVSGPPAQAPPTVPAAGSKPTPSQETERLPVEAKVKEQSPSVQPTHQHTGTGSAKPVGTSELSRSDSSSAHTVAAVLFGAAAVAAVAFVLWRKRRS